jgi:lipocalin-like protein
MTTHPSLASLLLVFSICLSASDVYPATNSQSLLGTWKLISDKQVKSDGSSSDLYGSSPLGQLIYDSRGNMSVHLLTADLTKCGTQDRRKCPDSAARSAFDNYLGYWGRFKVSAGGKSVVHIIEGASVPDWIGTSQERFFELAGDRLTLTTPLQQIAGVESKTVLVWQREK